MVMYGVLRKNISNKEGSLTAAITGAKLG